MLNNTDVSIVIRTLNEEKYLHQLLSSINNQDTKYNFEIILVDSGSKDGTLNIAKKFKCNIYHIQKKDFSFGRSLNLGCKNCIGKFIVIISGHCVPFNNLWLEKLIKPLNNSNMEYVYGRQIPGESSFLSEARIFAKYYPKKSNIPQKVCFSNNANSAIKKEIWEKYKFDEELTGLEDIDMAKKIQNEGGKIGYVADSIVYHYHRETWRQISRRFEREAIAYKEIYPNINIKITDSIRYFFAAILGDIKHIKTLSKTIQTYDYL